MLMCKCFTNGRVDVETFLVVSTVRAASHALIFCDNSDSYRFLFEGDGHPAAVRDRLREESHCSEVDPASLHESVQALLWRELVCCRWQRLVFQTRC